MRRLRTGPALALLLALVGTVGGCAPGAAPDRSAPRASAGGSPSHSSGHPSGSSGPSAPGGSRVLRLLARVDVVPDTAYHPGYDRSCAPGRGCVFGAEWTDDHPGPFGHNGCDTRQDVLLQQMHDIEMRWGSRCRIYQAWVVDPYSGERLTWRDDGYWIQVDHVYPLAAAWYAGAWAWPQERRVRFANDVRRELLAVSARANQDKGSATPAEWLPAYDGCRYLRKYLTVALAYDLPVTRADADAIAVAARRC